MTPSTAVAASELPTESGGAAPRAGLERSPRRIGTLDGIRAVSVLLVITAHLPNYNDWHFYNSHLPAGMTAVYIFFGLSGFLITRILLSAKRTGQTLRRFYVRRFLRIFPIYYLTVALVYLFMQRGDWIWPALTYTVNIFSANSPVGHAWSLGVEEQFYLIWPPLVWFLSDRNLTRVAILGLALWFGAEFAAEMVGWGDLLGQNIFRPAPFLAGALMALWEKDIRIRPVPYLIFGCVVSAAAWFGPHYCLPLRFVWKWDGRPAVEVFSIGVVLISLTIDGFRNPLTFLLRSQPLAWLAAISYGLYLYHLPIYGVMERYWHKEDFPNLLALSISVGAAIASYFLIEQPLQRLGPPSQTFTRKGDARKQDAPR